MYSYVIQIISTLFLFHVFSLNTKLLNAVIWFQIFLSNITNFDMSFPLSQRLKELSPFLVASPGSTVLDKKTRKKLVKQIFWLVGVNNLKEIKEVFERLQPEQCIKILNSTVQGCLPLYSAISFDRFEIASYLLEHSLVQGRRKMCEVWKNTRHPLIAAVIVNNLDLIKLILQNLYDINDNIFGHLSPLMIAIYLGNLMTVETLVAMGAEIDQPCIHGQTPLMISTSDNDICCFLSRWNVNINHQDEEGFTALHLAVTEGSKPCTNSLINAGADVKIRNNEGMNPLTWAAINLNIEEVIRLMEQSAYSVLDKIETLEIINACCIFSKKISLLGWKKALQMRTQNGLPKNCDILLYEILDFSQEFTTEMQLETIGYHPLRLAFQGILVIERILGRNNRVYIKVLLQTAVIAEQRKKFVKLQQLIDYIQDYCQDSSYVALNFLYFNNLFNEIAKYNDTAIFFEYGGFTVFKIIAQATINMWTFVKHNVYTNPFLIDRHYSELVDTFLYMTSAIRYFILFPPYLGQFEEEVKKVVREDVRLLIHQSLLHRAIKLMKTNRWSTVDLLRLLLESGADGNAKDYFQRTPIVYVSLNVPESFLNEVLTLFKEYGIELQG